MAKGFVMYRWVSGVSKILLCSFLAFVLCVSGLFVPQSSNVAVADSGDPQDITGKVKVSKVEMYVGGVLYITDGVIEDSSIEVKVGSSIEFKVYWNIPSGEMSGINENDFFEILLPGDYFNIFSTANPVKITAGTDNTEIGEMTIYTPVGGVPRFKVVLNAVGAGANSLDNGWLKATGKAQSIKDESESIEIGGITLPDFPIKDSDNPGGSTGTNPHPWNNPKPVSKNGFQTVSSNKVEWKVGVNEDLYAELYKTGSCAGRNNIVITDTLESGLVFNKIIFSSAYYYPYIDESTSEVKISSSLAYEVPLPDGSFTEVVELPNEDYDAFYDRVLAQSGPSYGVYQKKDVIISLKDVPGALKMALTWSEFETRANTDLSSGKLTQEQYNAFIDAYKNNVYNNNETASLVSLRISLGTIVYGDSRDVNNEVFMQWGTDESSSSSNVVTFNAIAGGAETGLPGSVVIKKFDSATGDKLDGATFKLQKYNPASSRYEDYTPRDGVSERTTVDGVATFVDLHYGEYRVVETGSLAGYLDDAVYLNGNTFTISSSTTAAIYIDAYNIKPDFSATKTVHNAIDFVPGDFAFEVQEVGGGTVAYGKASVSQNNTATPIDFFLDRSYQMPVTSWKNVFTLGSAYRLVEVGGTDGFEVSYSGGSGAKGNEFIATFTHDEPTINMEVHNAKPAVVSKTVSFLAKKTVSGSAAFQARDFHFVIKGKTTGVTVAYGKTSVATKDSPTDIIFFTDSSYLNPVTDWMNVFDRADTYQLLEIDGEGYDVTYRGGQGDLFNEFYVDPAHPDSIAFSFQVVNAASGNPSDPSVPSKQLPILAKTGEGLPTLLLLVPLVATLFMLTVSLRRIRRKVDEK